MSSSTKVVSILLIASSAAVGIEGQQTSSATFILDHSSVPAASGDSTSETYDAVSTAGDPVSTTRPSSESFVVESGSLIVPFPVDIDVKPGDETNAVNLLSGGVLTVAILTTSEFDADDVDVSLDENGNSLLRLSGSGARIKGNSNNYAAREDVDGDGDQDLVIQFFMSGLVEELLEMNGQTATLTLKGQTLNGTPISGTDSVLIVNQ